MSAAVSTPRPDGARPQRRRLFFITTYEPGTAPHFECVLWALHKAGWEITVITPPGDATLAPEVFDARWHTKTLSFDPHRRRVASEVSLFCQLLKARFGRYDVIYLHSQGLGYRAPLALLGPALGKRLVYHNPDYYDPITYPVRSRLEGALSRKCHLYMSSEYHRGYIARAQYRIKCPVLICPPNLPAAWPIPSVSEGRRREMSGECQASFVLRVHSSFDEFRMTLELFHALALLPQRFRLAMPRNRNPVTDQKTQAHLDKLGISDRVLRLPYMGYQEMLAYTVCADAGLLLYQNNDLGNFFQSPRRLTEYLACGLPLVASRFTGLENLVLRYGLGQCVDASRPRSIADGILRLEAEVRSGKYPRAEVRRKFEQHFAFEHWEPRVVAAFEDLVKHRGRRRQSLPPANWSPGDDGTP